MNKLYIISELFPPDETSTAFILGEIANVMTRKYEVKVLCGPEIYDKRKKKDPNNNFKLDNRIEVIHVNGVDTDKNTFWGKAVRFAVISKQLYRAAKKNIKKEDKVLLVTNPAPLVALVSKLKKKNNFELNILVHDVFPENTIPAGLRIPNTIYGLLKRVFDKSYSRADQLIALGRDMKCVLEEKVSRYEHKPQITIIENWADVDLVSPSANCSYQEQIIIEYAGNIGRVQGLQSMIEDVQKAQNDNMQLHLWGTGAEENRLKEYITTNGMKNVVFHGAYMRSMQSQVINSCDLALVTLTKGMYGLGVPSKTYNIMAAGKAILFIGDANSEIGLLVKEKKIGYVFDPADRESIIRFISQLSQSKREEFNELGKRARMIAVSEYTKDVILKKFVNAL